MATRYGERVTALWSFDERPRTGDPLRPGATPAAIRAALLPDDAAAFDVAYRAWLAQARESLELAECSGLGTMMTLGLLQRDPARFGSVVRRAAERVSGEPVPEDEPLDRTHRRVGL